ncbi:putative ensconsin-like [Cocos nucifera]|nr:putative ensconsin-like [Cocos nucifera]
MIRVDISSFTTPTNATATPVVADGIEVALAAEVGSIDGATVPPTSSSLPTEVQVLELPARGGKREKKKEKKKSITIKVWCKAHPNESNDDNEDLEENLFYNQNIIEDLVDKFALFEVVVKIANFDYEQHTWDSLRTFLEVTNCLPTSKW